MSKEGKSEKPEIKSVSALLHKAGVDTAVAIDYDRMYERLQILLDDARTVKKLFDEARTRGYGSERIAEGPINQISTELMKRCVILAEFVSFFAGEAKKIETLAKEKSTNRTREIIIANRKFLDKAELEGVGSALIKERLTGWLKDHKRK